MKRLLLLGIALLVLCACGDSTTETAPVGIVPELAPEEEIVCPGTVRMLPNPPANGAFAEEKLHERILFRSKHANTPQKGLYMGYI